MEYFDLKSFLLRLDDISKGRFTIKNLTKKGESMKLKLMTKPSDFAYLTLKNVNNNVVVDLDFSLYSTSEFKHLIITTIKTLIEEEH